jgi:site-specific DNA recombinase
MNGSNRIRLVKQRVTDRQVQTEAVATNAAGYIRVSTEEQASNGHGLEIQDRAIRSFAESQGYRLIDVVSDPGVSGGAKRPEERPGFRKIIELAQARKFSVLLVWKFDRLARNLLFSVTSVHDLREQYAVVRYLIERGTNGDARSKLPPLNWVLAVSSWDPLWITKTNLAASPGTGSYLRVPQ